MFRLISGKRGIALFLVLGILLVVVILANVVLTIIVSQSRLTHHQVSRIQAYYASMAGINLAMENLRNGIWIAGTNCTAGAPCIWAFATDDFQPASIVENSVSIVINLPQGTDASQPCFNPPGGGACITVTADYTAPQ